MRANQHVHTAGDGAGRREVTLNGVKVDRVVYADTKRGVVRVALMRPDRWGKRVLSRSYYGRVEVSLLDPLQARLFGKPPRFQGRKDLKATTRKPSLPRLGRRP